MELILFILLLILEMILLLFFIDDRKNIWKAGSFYLTSFLLGSYYYVSGVQYQTGWTIVTSGTTQTITTVTTDLITAQAGFAYFGWLLIGLGFYGLIVKIIFPLFSWGKN